jgi:hypothetical protein
MKKEFEHLRDIQTGDWQIRPDKNLTPTITGCDSGQTTDRKEEDSNSQKLYNHVPSESDLHIK